MFDKDNFERQTALAVAANLWIALVRVISGRLPIGRRRGEAALPLPDGDGRFEIDAAEMRGGINAGGVQASTSSIKVMSAPDIGRSMAGGISIDVLSRIRPRRAARLAEWPRLSETPAQRARTGLHQMLLKPGRLQAAPPHCIAAPITAICELGATGNGQQAAPKSAV